MVPPIDSFRLNTGIAAIDCANPSLLVFPNPCRDQLNIPSSSDLYGTTLSLVNLNGQTFFTKNSSTYQTCITFVLPNAANGLYLLENRTPNTLLSNTKVYLTK